MSLIVGVDAGATKTFALVADGNGYVLGFGQGGPGNHQVAGLEPALAEIRRSCEEALAQAGASPLVDLGFFGLAGADLRIDFALLTPAVEGMGIARRVCIKNDTISSEPGESFQATTTKDGKTAESVFIAGLFVLAAKEMAAIARWQGQQEQAQQYEQKATQMETTVVAHGWDGAWFLRAYDDFGHKVGSRECEEGKIYVEPQGLCIMAGIGLDNGADMAGKALASVREHLATPHGILLQQPAYFHYYLHLGEISSYPPGYKENASVFCHTNPWIMIAEAILGHGDRAHDYYLRLNPSAQEEMADLHRCEPYVYAQTIAGRDAPNHGEAKNSWLTGTAAWNYVAIIQWILGVRPTFDGLQIAPVIPRGWRGFEVTRIFRNVRYRISVRRVGEGNAVSITVDGRPMQGNVLPLPTDGQSEVEVKVALW